MTSKIFDHDWEDIKRAQSKQGSLHKKLDLSKPSGPQPATNADHELHKKHGGIEGLKKVGLHGVVDRLIGSGIHESNDLDTQIPVVEPSDNDVGRLNQLFDMLTAKRFLSPVIFVQAVRGALNLYGINLDHLEIEGVDGATPKDGPFIQAGVSSPTNPDMYAPPVDGEYVFSISDEMYLYMVIDRDEEGLYECYAQVVSEDELDDLMNMDKFEKDFPELIGDRAGETEYEAQIRHTGYVDTDGPTE